MQQYDKRLKNFLIFSLAAIFVFSIVRITIVKKNIFLPTDHNPAYTVAKNLTTNTFSITVLVLIAVFGIFSLMMVRQECSNSSCFNDSPTIFFSALIGFMGLSTAALFIYHILINKMKVTNLDLGVLISLILTSIYFFYISSRARKRGNGIFITLSFFPVAYAILRVLSIFIPAREVAADSTVLFRLFGLAFMMLFFVTELKAAGGTPNPRATVFLGLTTIFLNLLFQIPDIALSAFWLLNFDFNSVLTAVDMFITLYIAARLIAMTEQNSTEPSSTDHISAEEDDNDLEETVSDTPLDSLNN